MKPKEYRDHRHEVNAPSTGGRGLDLLLVVHGLPPQRLGGTELATMRLADALAERHNVTVLTPGRPAPGDEGGRVRILRMEPPGRRRLGFEATWRDPRWEGALGSFLSRERFDVCHVHHLTGLSLTLPAVAMTRGIPVILTLHDAWLACARGQLVDVDLKVCAGPSQGGCARCLADHLAVGGPILQAAQRAATALAPGRGAAMVEGLWRALPASPMGRRALHARLASARYILSRAARVTAPSSDLLARFHAFGWLEPASAAGRVRRLDNLLPGPRVARTAPPDGPLRLLFVGPLIPTKGIHVLLAALRALPPGKARLTVVGPDQDFHRAPGFSAAQRQGAPPEVRWLGELDHAATMAELEDAHALVMPSIWPENASVILREALLRGVPVVASALGGTPEVLTPEAGILVPPGDASALGAALTSLLDPGARARLARGAEAILEERLGARIEDWEALYQELVARGPRSA